jgi:short-subunit dehydrogenase
MKKAVLITGSTDVIGYATANSILEFGHIVLLHERGDVNLAASQKKLGDKFI